MTNPTPKISSFYKKETGISIYRVDGKVKYSVRHNFCDGVFEIEDTEGEIVKTIPASRKARRQARNWINWQAIKAARQAA